MFRGATRGAFRSAREILRASKRKNGSKRSIDMLVREESALGGGQQRRAFGRANSDTIARALSVGVCGMLDRNVIDALNLVTTELTAEDDDGR